MSPKIVKAVAAVVIVATIGCDDEPSRYPVTGKVLVDRKPASGVYVVFNPLEKGIAGGVVAGSARTGVDGTYASRLPTVGSYAITCFWPSVIEREDETLEGPDRLRGQYQNVQQPVLTVEIAEQPNEIPAIELSSRRRS